MPLTLIHALLGVICACILFGNSSVNAESDKLQTGQDRELPGLTEESPETITVAPTKRRTSRRKTYQFPIKDKGGVPYFDLAGVNLTKVEITGRSRQAKGITASHGNCKVQSLLVDTKYSEYMLDEDLITNCPHLNLTLQGDKWRCLKEGLMLHRREVEVNMTEAYCNDAWLDEPSPTNARVIVQKYSMAEGIQKLLDFDINNCPVKMCICKWYFKNYSYAINVDCDNVGLTDDNLPVLPDTIRGLILNRNGLRSMDSLVKYLLPHHHILHEVRLDGNFFEELPRFPKDTFPKIAHLSLNSNKIKEIHIEIFEELITRKTLDISLVGNTFPCDCNLYNFKIFLLENYLRHWNSFKTYMDMECDSKGQDKKMKMHNLSEELCKTWLDRWQSENWWWVLNFTLGVLNVVVIVLMVDLICILKRGGCDRMRVPLMGRLLYYLFGIAHQKMPTNDYSENREMSSIRERESF